MAREKLTTRELLERRGFSSDRIDDLLKRREKAKQRKSLIGYKKRTPTMARKLRNRYDIDVPDEPPMEERSWGLENVWDLFFILEYPIFNLLESAASGESFDKTLKSFFKGFTLQEKTSGDELLEAFGMADGTGRSVLGFTLEILGNPANFVTGPLGLTRLGKLSRFKALGKLDSVKRGSKLAKKVMGAVPGASSFDDAVRQIPAWTSDMATQGTRGIRSMLKVGVGGGTPVIKGSKALGALQKVGNKIGATRVAEDFRTLFGKISTPAIQNIANGMRWNWGFGHSETIKQAAEIRTFVEKFGPKSGQMLIRLNEDPLFSAWSTIIMADKVAGDIGKAAGSRIRQASSLAKAVRRSVPKMDDALEKAGVLSLKRGTTKEDSAFIFNQVKSFIGKSDTAAKHLNVNNGWVKTLLSDSPKITSNYHLQEEFFKIIDPTPAIRNDVARVMASTSKSYNKTLSKLSIRDKAVRLARITRKPSGEFETARRLTSIKQFQTLWEKQATPAMKIKLSKIIDDMYSNNSAPGMIGHALNGGASESELLSISMHNFAKDPSLVLAEDPRMFFFLQSLTRFAPKTSTPSVAGPMIKKASMRHQSMRVITLLHTFGMTKGSKVRMTSKGKNFLNMFKSHLANGEEAGTLKGSISRLYPWALGSEKKVMTQKGLQYHAHKISKDIEKFIKGLGEVTGASGTKKGVKYMFQETKATKNALDSLVKSGLLTKELADDVAKLTIIDKTNIYGRLQALQKHLVPVAKGNYAKQVSNSVTQLKKAKAFENTVFGLLTAQYALPGAVKEGFKPHGTGFVELLDELHRTGINIRPETYKLARAIGKKFEDWGRMEKALGILAASRNNYMPHKKTQAAKDAIPEGNVVTKSLSKFNDKFAAGEGRNIEGTIDEINKLWRKHRGSYGKAYQEIDKLFIDDPAQLYALRGLEHYRAVSYVSGKQEIARKFGKEVSETFALTAKERGLKKIIKVKGMDGRFVVPKHVAEYLEGFERVISNQDVLRGMKRAIHEMSLWWKSWTLGIFPAYHVRNGISNINQNVIAGMNPGRVLYWSTKARRMTKYGMHLSDEMMVLPSGKKASLREMYEAGMRRGVEGTGMFTAEVFDVAEDSIDFAKRMGAKPFKPLIKGAKSEPQGYFKAMRAAAAKTKPKGRMKGAAQYIPLVGRKHNKTLAGAFLAGRGIENNARWSHFMWRVVQKGDTYDEAARSVAKYLYDYNDVSIAMSKMRDIFPFIVWSRKNIPRQIQNLAEHPLELGIFAKGINLFEKLVNSQPVDFPNLPEFIRESVPLQVSRTKSGDYKYFLLGNWLASTDLHRILNPVDGVMNLLNPGLKLPFELAWNYSSFFDSPIDPGPYQKKRKFLGLNMPPRVAHVLKSIRTFATLNRLLGLNDHERDTSWARALKFGTGMSVYEVDPQLELLKRYANYTKRLGKRLSYERFEETR